MLPLQRPWLHGIGVGVLLPRWATRQASFQCLWAATFLATVSEAVGAAQLELPRGQLWRQHQARHYHPCCSGTAWPHIFAVVLEVWNVCVFGMGAPFLLLAPLVGAAVWVFGQL